MKNEIPGGGFIMLPVMPQKPSFTLPAVGNGEPIGKRIARIRKSRGLTQEEVAARIGINQNLFSAYERGRLRINAEMLAQIAVSLETSADEIIGLVKTEEREPLNKKLLRRLKEIETLPEHKRRILVTNIDVFLKSFSTPKNEGELENQAER